MLTTTFEVAWGDCDAAGIVFYPRFFAFMDQGFQRLLQSRGLSQQTLQREYGAVTPIVEAHASFRSPARPNDELTLQITVGDWGRKLFKVETVARHGDRVVFEGYEVRVLASPQPDGSLKALQLPAAFRDRLAA